MELTEEQKERRREACRRYYHRNKEQAAERNRQWHKNNTARKRETNRAWREANPEKVKDQARASYWRNPEQKRARANAWYAANTEACKQRASSWSKANPEKVAESSRIWREANPEKRKSIAREWAKRNPEKCLANVHRRNARKLAASSPFAVVTDAVIAERKALTDGCAFCGADEKLTLEHVVALKDGGLHVPSNLIGSCLSCNCSKNASPVEAWYKAQPFFSEQRWQRIQEITGNGQLSLI